ncbi:MAG: AsnC family protein, partial [Acinetobacter sp.]
VHRTGQAVGNRIAKMQDEGLIQKYTIELNYSSTQFIHVMMQNNEFERFEAFIAQFDAIESGYKVCGSACYMLVTHFDNHTINHFIEQLSEWGQYSVDSVVRAIEPQP